MSGQSNTQPERFKTWVIVWQWTKYPLLIVILISGLFTVGRPYQTGDMALGLRASMWFIVVALTVFQVLGLWSVFRRTNAPYLLALPLSILTATLLLSFELDLLKQTPLLPKARDPLFDFFLFLLPAVTLIGVTVIGVHQFLLTHRPKTAEIDSVTETADSSQAEGYQETGDFPLADAIRYVHAQEHYLIIATDAERIMLRMRMRDAVARLSTADGMQVHRSWWVCKAHIEKTVRRGRDFTLYLKDGTSVPIARARVDRLRSAGWLR